jgi:hypothetical protein
MLARHRFYEAGNDASDPARIWLRAHMYLTCLVRNAVIGMHGGGVLTTSMKSSSGRL